MGAYKSEKDMESAGIHQETVLPHRNAAPVTLGEAVVYDHGGPMGIIRSPYVFGAALLASMGGFSFGYGKVSRSGSCDVYTKGACQTKESSPSSS